MTTVELDLDNSPMMRALDDMGTLLRIQTPDVWGLIKVFFRRFELPGKFFAINREPVTTFSAGTHCATYAVEPNDFYRRFMAALGAGNIERFIVEHNFSSNCCDGISTIEEKAGCAKHPAPIQGEMK